MFRNQELKHYLRIQLIFAALCLIFAIFLFHPLYIIIVLAIGLIGINLWFTKKRYEKLNELNEYLVKIQNNDFSLDLRDNVEGELSILKNEIYKITKILSSQTDALQKDKIYLVDSISDISHQLKTPLTSMIIMTDLLDSNHLPMEKRQEFIKNISVALHRMEWLITSLLKLSKLDADSVQFKKVPINLKELVWDSYNQLELLAKEKDITFMVDGLETIQIKGDYPWLMEALSNLIRNSIQHSENGHSVEVSLEENNLYTKVVIKDSGRGIDKEDIPYIFKRFYRGKNATSDSVGIGLALSNQILLKHKAKIQVESTVELGSKFIILFYK